MFAGQMYVGKMLFDQKMWHLLSFVIAVQSEKKEEKKTLFKISISLLFLRHH
jgi:hypothetical protein